MKTLFLSLGMLMIVSTAMGQDGTEGVNWVDVNYAFEEAPKAGKMVLIDFYTDWCGWCKRMDKTTYADSSVIDYMSEYFLASKVNPEKEGSITFGGQTYTPRQFASGLNVTGYPTTCIFIPAAEGEDQPTVIPISGYRTAEQLLSLLRFLGEKAYLTMSYEEYVAGTGASGSGEKK